MNPIDDVCRQMTTLDLTMMVVVEDGCGIDMPVQPKTIAGLISGAPIPEVRDRLERLVGLGALEKTPGTYRLTSLGASVLEREVADWEPSRSEQARRDRLEAVAARARSNGSG